MRFLRKVDKLNIEKLLKKAWNKPSYKALRREDFLHLAASKEENYVERLYRLRQTRQMLRNSNICINMDTILDFFITIDQLSHNEQISRQLFMQSVVGRLH